VLTNNGFDGLILTLCSFQRPIFPRRLVNADLNTISYRFAYVNRFLAGIFFIRLFSGDK